MERRTSSATGSRAAVGERAYRRRDAHLVAGLADSRRYWWRVQPSNEDGRAGESERRAGGDQHEPVASLSGPTLRPGVVPDHGARTLMERLFDRPESDDQVLTITIPFSALAQGRPRAVKDKNGRVWLYDPPASKAWKKIVAAHYMKTVLRQHGRMPYFPEGPIHLSAVFFATLPKSEHRKSSPPVARYNWKHDGDLTNLIKSLEDAGNGIIWKDDSQISSLTASRWICAQGQKAFTKITVRKISTDFRLGRVDEI